MGSSNGSDVSSTASECQIGDAYATPPELHISSPMGSESLSINQISASTIYKTLKRIESDNYSQGANTNYLECIDKIINQKETFHNINNQPIYSNKIDLLNRNRGKAEYFLNYKKNFI